MKRILPFGLLVSLTACQNATLPASGPQRIQSQTAATQSNSQALREQLQRVSPQRGLHHFIQPASTDLNNIPQDPKNPLTPEKIKLGQLLYHDTALGLKSKSAQSMETYSCATCHHAAAGFQANRRQGLSDGGIGYGRRGETRQPHPELQLEQLDFQPVKTPAALNLAWQPNMLWNGQLGARGLNTGTQSLWRTQQNSTLFIGIESNKLGFDGVETQALVGQEAHRLSLEKVKEIKAYQALFAEAFPGLAPQKQITPVNAALAIASFERTLLSNQAPFQRWLRGDLNAMNNSQLRGALLFFGKAGCVSCHSGPALNSMRFEALGLNDMLGSDVLGANPKADQHLGRGSFTKNPQDNFKFKVPQLYNLADSPFYGHGGSIRSLEAFVSYMNAGQAENPRVPRTQLAKTFRPLGLSAAEERDLVNFLKEGLRDPNLKRYQPQRVPSGNCLPNNDPISRRELGCN